MRITQENYEKYFIDYLDGNLTEHEIELFEVFLSRNPDLRADLEGLEKIRIHPLNDLFPEKGLLKKPDLTLPVSGDNFEDFSTGSTEGDLDDHASAKLWEYCVAHPERLRTYFLYKKLHLSPDRSILFPYKNRLKKPVISVSGRITFTAISIAATIVFLLLIIKRPEFQAPHNKYSNPADRITQNDEQVSPVRMKQEGRVLSEAIRERKKSDSQEVSPAGKPHQDDEGIRVFVADKKISEEERDRGSRLGIISIPKPEMNISLLNEKELDLSSYILRYPNEEHPSTDEYLSIADLARSEVYDKILNKQENRHSKLSAWDIAGAGIHGINRITGSSMKLEKKEEPERMLKKIQFESKFFSISASVHE
jgi:hypothetical protein